MTIFTALNQEMKNTAAITAIVGTGDDARIFPGIPPPDATAPFISFRRISYRRVNALTGQTTLANAIIQIDCWGNTNDAVDSLSEAVRTALDGFRGVMGDGTFNVRRANLQDQDDDPEDPVNAGPNKIHRDRMDLDIWFIE